MENTPFVKIYIILNGYFIYLGTKYHGSSNLNLHQMTKSTLELQVNVGNKIEPERKTVDSILCFFKIIHLQK